MTEKIQVAIPTDKAALQYLQENYPELSDNAISPLLAKELHPRYITEKFNFICPTINCSAPVTCRSLSSDSVYSPSFVNQSINNDLHITGCIHSPNADTTSLASEKDSKNRFSNEHSGKLVSDMGLLYFSKPEPKKAKSSKHLDKIKESLSITETKRTTTNKENLNKEKRKVNHHLTNLKDHVDCYTTNKYCIINSKLLKGSFPISQFFQFISDNPFDKNLKDNTFLRISFGQCWVSSIIKNKSILKVTFSNPISTLQGELQASFIINRNYFENEFPDLIQYIDSTKPVIRTYIRSPFTLVSIKEKYYLNFLISIEDIPFNTYFLPIRELDQT